MTQEILFSDTCKHVAFLFSFSENKTSYNIHFASQVFVS